MKHLQKFETFSIELNENIFQDGFSIIKSKIANWKDNIVSYFNQGLNYVKNNQNDPDVQEIVDAIDNLPENERMKLQTIVDDPNSAYDKIKVGANSIQESVSANIEKGMLKILGWGAILGPIVNLGLAVANTTFLTAGSAYNTPTSHMGGPAMATIFVCIGVVVGAYLTWVADQKK